MPWTKERVTEAAKSALGERVVWASVCENLLALKIDSTDGATAADVDRDAGAARRALHTAAERDRLAIDSLVIEFVDRAGTVVATRKFGAGAPPTSASVASNDRNPVPAGGEGHRPIGGLGASKAPTPQSAAGTIPGVKHIIAVGAGKGGVGKSTVALNLAVGLARRGHAAGLLDGDIYGPSMPTMLGLDAYDTHALRGMLQPFFVHGIKCMTIGKLVDADKPLIWRGPMAHGAFKQLTDQTEWGELEYLIIDLPPGTGDISLTMAQTLRLTGAVVVCTPQKVAQDDAVRAARMFQQLGIPILGVVENMSIFIGDDGKTYDIFGRGGAEMMAQRLNLPFLGSLPLTMGLRRAGDEGDPTRNFTSKDEPGRQLSAALERMVTNVESQVALASLKSGATRPTLTIS